MTKFNWSKLYKKWYIILLFSFVITLLSYSLGSITFLKEIEYRLIDYRFRFTSSVAEADSNIVVVAIDDGSLDFFEQNNVTWPWPRSYYAYFVNYLEDCGAKCIFFDVIFDSADTEREETTAAQTDGAFAAAIQNSSVILAAKLLPDSTSIPNKLESLNIKKFVWNPHQYRGIRAPIDTLLATCSNIGIINVSPASDGIIREIPMLYNVESKILPQMALSVYLQKNPIEKLSPEIPVDEKGNYFINWYGLDSFSYYPFQAVIQSAAASQNKAKQALPDEIFKDKYVIVGATASGLNDLRATPLSSFQPGLEIWTTVLSNYLNNDFVRKLSVNYSLILALLVSFIIMYLLSHYKLKTANPLSLLLLLLVSGLYLLIWWQNRVLLNYTIVFVAIFITYIFYLTVSYLVEGKSRAEIKKIFSRYLSPDVISELEQEPEKVVLGGKQLQATIMFSDIYNFTTYSEGKKPQEVVNNLNQYFEKITNYVLENGGLLDKYTGDGIMALFGVPVYKKQHAYLACKAALQHRQYCQELTKTKSELSMADKLHLKTRLGINSGDIIAGNIGSQKRMDYTVIGDAANLAARLEGVNKIFLTNIIISGSTYQLVKNSMLCRELDFLRVKGKKEATRIYELLNEKQDETIPQWVQDYHRALQLYRNGQWQDAQNIFGKLAQPPYNDKPAKVMLDRCQELLKNPPEKWDGILTLEVK
ncbi:MAG: adenylate/guanylate cyclase domain-containing protein [Candidatus Cloacimonadota bacterium]|nr:adenylate/guanylate cyclase domain-containing protein [Candidatus Cloacimonadota bacterium]